jgi:hypothetical protein
MTKNITQRKCKDCDIIIDYIPRKVRCLNCHQKHIDNAMISTKRDDAITEGKQYEWMKHAINKIEGRNVDAITDSIFKVKKENELLKSLKQEHDKHLKQAVENMLKQGRVNEVLSLAFN